MSAISEFAQVQTAPLLMDVSGSSLLNGVIMVIVFGIIFGLLWWVLDYLKLPEPFAKVARVILVLAAVILLINILLSFAGHGFIRW